MRKLIPWRENEVAFEAVIPEQEGLSESKEEPDPIEGDEGGV